VLNPFLNKQEKDKKWEQQRSALNYKMEGENPDDIGQDEEESETLKGRTEWVSFTQQYFNITIANTEGFDRESLLRMNNVKADTVVRDMEAQLYLNYNLEDDRTYAMRIFAGPNDYDALEEADLGVKNHRLESIIPLGWGIFGWINEYMVIPLFNVLTESIAMTGLAIILLTIIIKFLLLPLVYKSYISTAKMRILKPEIERIKEKYNGDMQKQQTENMALYKKAGVSPMSGCVPLLFQMPVLFAMFQFFPSAFQLRQKSFLWADDLSRYDSIFNIGFDIPFYGDHVSLFTLLMTLSTLLYTHFNNQITGASGQMKYIGYIMPVVFIVLPGK
jgi:YidC/Oxa1 family membrane protein insertase